MKRKHIPTGKRGENCTPQIVNSDLNSIAHLSPRFTGKEASRENNTDYEGIKLQNRSVLPVTFKSKNQYADHNSKASDLVTLKEEKFKYKKPSYTSIDL